MDSPALTLGPWLANLKPHQSNLGERRVLRCTAQVTSRSSGSLHRPSSFGRRKRCEGSVVAQEGPQDTDAPTGERDNRLHVFAAPTALLEVEIPVRAFAEMLVRADR